MKPHLNLVTGRGGGTPVFFQHGLCGSATQTAEAFPEDPRFTMMTLECRGHGASEPGNPNEFSIANFAQDVGNAIQAEVGGPVILGGISMGAAIALHLAVHQPHLVKALVLARPAWVVEAWPPSNRPNTEVGQLLAQWPPDIAKAMFLASPTARALAETAPDNLKSLVGFFDRAPFDITSALLTRISTDGPGVTEADVRNLRLPTLIIGTAQDAIHPLAFARELQGLIPHARLVEITPKGVDKTAYVAEFRGALLRFFEENT